MEKIFLSVRLFLKLTCFELLEFGGPWRVEEFESDRQVFFRKILPKKNVLGGRQMAGLNWKPGTAKFYLTTMT